jgi:hypothetical protein
MLQYSSIEPERPEGLFASFDFRILEAQFESELFP